MKRIGKVIGVNFQRMLRKKGFDSLRSFSKASGLSYSTLHQIYEGSGNPELDTLRNMATAFDMTTGALVKELLTIE